MKESVRQLGTGPVQQAGTILKAWMCQDDIALRKELKNGLDLCWASEPTGLEDEHLELLKAVASGLNQSPTPPSAQPADPVVRLCIDLLLHLAAQDAASSRFTTESETQATFRC